MPSVMSFGKFSTSGWLSFGRITSFILYLFATMTFYLIPWVLSTWPLRVISPVRATSGLTLDLRARDTRDATMVMESVEPSFLKAPSGACTCTSFSYRYRLLQFSNRKLRAYVQEMFMAYLNISPRLPVKSVPRGISLRETQDFLKASMQVSRLPQSPPPRLIATPTPILWWSLRRQQELPRQFLRFYLLIWIGTYSYFVNILYATFSKRLKACFYRYRTPGSPKLYSQTKVSITYAGRLNWAGSTPVLSIARLSRCLLNIQIFSFLVQLVRQIFSILSSRGLEMFLSQLADVMNSTLDRSTGTSTKLSTKLLFWLGSRIQSSSDRGSPWQLDPILSISSSSITGLLVPQFFKASMILPEQAPTYVLLCPLRTEESVTPPKEMLQNLRLRAFATDLAKEVLPKPGPPMKQKIFPLRLFLSFPTAITYRIASLTSFIP